MWMSTDFGEDGIKPVNTCSLQQIVTETSLTMDSLQTMGIALDRRNAYRYLQELKNRDRTPEKQLIAEALEKGERWQVCNRNGRSLLWERVG
jgi:hypothetical protein